MPEIHDSDPSVTGARVGRRPIALGAAWALPTLGATFAAPAFAASPLPCTFPIATPKVTATAPSGGTKGTQNWTVPTGVTAICVEVRGGAGGGSSSARVGGAGALIRAQIAVTPGEILSLTTGAGGIRVTGFGAVAGGTGYGNGGSSPAGGSSGGSGGGGSAIVRGTTPLIVAGGGGGAGSNDVQSGDFTGSANGGYQTASNPDGTTPNFSWSNISTVSIAPGPGKGAVGATAGAGGSGGTVSAGGTIVQNSPGNAGTAFAAGVPGNGGNGVTAAASGSSATSGGGGGGYSGGGSGQSLGINESGDGGAFAAGGGAGSSFVASTGVYSSVQTIGPTNPTIDTRVQGFIRIFY